MSGASDWGDGESRLPHDAAGHDGSEWQGNKQHQAGDNSEHLASVRILNISKPEARAVQPILRNDNHCANSLAA